MKRLILKTLLTLSIFSSAQVLANSADSIKVATFAGGCFWCMEPPFDKLEGVVKTISGYSGGELKDPSYRQVSSGRTKHIEAIQVHYDPKKVSYKKLLQVFWRQIDPTDNGGQFVDRGYQYSSAIFYNNATELKLAQDSKKEVQKYFKNPILTDIRKAMAFYPAEEYHQDYYLKNPIRYKFYRYNSGRDQFLNKVWKK